MSPIYVFNFLYGSSSMYIYDPVHLNNEGSRLAADIIAGRFLRSDTLMRALAE